MTSGIVNIITSSEHSVVNEFTKDFLINLALLALGSVSRSAFNITGIVDIKDLSTLVPAFSKMGDDCKVDAEGFEVAPAFNKIGLMADKSEPVVVDARSVSTSDMDSY
jgi:hypothetical protein